MVHGWVPHNQDSFIVQTVTEEAPFGGDQLQKTERNLSLERLGVDGWLVMSNDTL